MRRLTLIVFVASLALALLSLGLLIRSWGIQPYSTALLIGSLLPYLLLDREFAFRSRHPRGAPHITYDDFLGKGPLPEFIRQTFVAYNDLIAANLPGPLDRFTLVLIDRPFGRRFPRRKPSEEIRAITHRFPILKARAFVREHGLPSQPLVAVLSSAWEPHLHTLTKTHRELERILAKTLYHELCHVFGYPHGRGLNRLERRFGELLSNMEPGGPQSKP